MKSTVYTILCLGILFFSSCKKDDSNGPAAYTNKGDGFVNYNGKDTLTVTADNGQYFLIQGNSIPNQSAVVSLSIVFPNGRPKAGYYTPKKDSIQVNMTGSSSLYWQMRDTDTITVTTSGNTMNATFTHASFNLLNYPGTSNYYNGRLTSN